MNYKEKIKSLLYKIFPSLEPRYGMTIKGDYLLRYIINKYFNKTKPNDYIEEYEKIISNFEKYLDNTEYEKFYTSENNINYSIKHFMAAVRIFNLMTSAPNLQKKYWGLITDSKILSILSDFYLK